jgi:spore coat protein U-like protein
VPRRGASDSTRGGRALRALNRLLAAIALTAALPAQALCTATAGSVAFGTYNPLSASPADSTGSVTVTCTGIGLLVSYDIQLSAGGSGTYTPRRLAVLGNTLNYNLFTNSSRTTVWGNGTGGTATVSDGYTLSLGTVIRSYTVHGRVPAAQNAATGSYADTIIVTVNY